MKPNQKEILYSVTAYLWILGFIIAFFLNKELRSAFVTHHIKNMFGLIILSFVGLMTNAYIHIIIGELLYLISIGIWLISIVFAFLGKEIIIPYLTENYQKWFKFLD